jgi:hypothetical protein
MWAIFCMGHVFCAMKALCNSKYKMQKNYPNDFIICSKASRCALKAFSPAFVAA